MFTRAGSQAKCLQDIQKFQKTLKIFENICNICACLKKMLKNN